MTMALCFTAVTYLFIVFFISPYISEPANGLLVSVLRTVGVVV